MTEISKPDDLVDKLKAFETFQDIPTDALQWLVDHSRYLYYEEDDYLFEPGQAADHMLIIVEGEYVIRISRNGRTRELGAWGTGNITGVLPFSRMKETVAAGQALRDTYVLELHRNCFTEMVNVCYDLVQALVSVMTTRVRDFSQLRFQDEKLLALGKLSAGLAHELNNPAAAIVRSSDELYRKVHQTPERFKQIITMKVTPEETNQINAILYAKIEEANHLTLSLLEREERLDELTDWLEDHDITNADDIAEIFTDFGITPEELDQVADIVNTRDLATMMWWLESTLSLERLVAEIKESSSRISALISAIKSYSHMDQAAVMAMTDVHEGLRATLMILKHKLRDKKIEVNAEFGEDIPKIKAFGGELNQIWTNIIVNAVQAMAEGGKLNLRTYTQRGRLCIEIADNGPGIPEDIQTRIFEPFFTTKAMDEGTGLGLDIVKRIVDRHYGEIKVNSQPGRTVFTISLPVEQAPVA